MNPSNEDKILIISPGWVGDLIMAQALFKLLKRQQPACIIDVLAPRWAHPLLMRMPEINEHIVAEFQHGELKLRKRFQCAKQLQSRNYSRSIILPNSFKSALIPWLAKIKHRTGWLGEQRWGIINDRQKSNKKDMPLMVSHYLALAQTNNQSLLTTPIESVLLPSLSVNIDKQHLLLKTLNLRLDKPVLALCPGAKYGSSKQWPSNYFSVLARHMLRQDWQVWIFGSPEDSPIAKKIHQSCSSDYYFNLCGKTKLNDAIDLLSLARIVVSNDSGLMHMASALKRPLVVLYGATTPKFAPPLTKKHVILYRNLSCQPCLKRLCPLKHFKCMRELPPQKVIHAMQQLDASVL